MTTPEITFGIISSIGTLGSIVIALVMIWRRNEVAVSFNGTPVDKKEFDAHVNEYKANNHAVWAKMESDSKHCLAQISEVHGNVSGIKGQMEMINSQCGLMNLKLDNINRKT